MCPVTCDFPVQQSEQEQFRKYYFVTFQVNIKVNENVKLKLLLKEQTTLNTVTDVFISRDTY